MADASQLEAELLAALGAPAQEPEKPVAAATDPLPAPTQSPAALGRLSEAALAQPPAPASPIPPDPAEPFVSQPATAAAHGPTVTAPIPTPAPSAPDTLPASSPNTSKVPSPPPPQRAQSFAQPLAAPQSDGVTVPGPAAHQAPRARSPKRPRSPGGIEGNGTKRQRTDQTSTGPTDRNAVQGPNLDLAAMLSDALADFDQQTNPGVVDAVMQDADAPQPAAPASTTPDPEKAENKIMRASANPLYVMRSMSLPVLGNIAVQVLLRLSQQPRPETESLLADPSSDFRKAYDMLSDIFRATRRAFSDSPLLSPDELDITDSEDRETIRMSNLAATAASLFGGHDVSLWDVHGAFFSIFIPEDGEYRSSLTDLLLGLKTRLLLDALAEPEQPQRLSQLLDTLFPADFDAVLRQRSGDVLLNVDEEALVGLLQERRAQLVESAADESIKKSLEDLSSVDKITESLSVFLQSHLGVVVDYAEKYGVNIPLNEEDTPAVRDPNSAQREEHDGLAALLQSATSHLSKTEADAVLGKGALSNGTAPEQGASFDDDGLALKKLIEESLSSHVPAGPKDSMADPNASAALPDFDSKNLASLISEKLKSELDMATHDFANLSASAQASNLAEHGTAAVHPQYLAQLNQSQASAYQSRAPGSAPLAPAAPGAEALPPNQSMPTAALYEKARQAAVAKSSNTTRREGLHSTRRPWTPEEEKALMAGLDMVKGPHWSQILSLFGPHGTISDILKDRTQVQLKDKARNLKLFFLKTNSEMPYYLQSVTGELKTRAPSQAARKEAEEKARMNLEEEQARIQGIMTLAGGLQNNHHSVPSASLAGSPSKRASPAAGGGVGGNAAAPQAPVGGTSMPPAVPVPPRVKAEATDHHSLQKVAAFPPIQPAPAPGQATQQSARQHLPHPQPHPQPHPHPQPGVQQPPPRPQGLQQQCQKPQQPQQPQQPGGPGVPKAPMAMAQQHPPPVPRQQQQSLQAGQQQALQPQQQQQPQRQLQSQSQAQAQAQQQQQYTPTQPQPQRPAQSYAQLQAGPRPTPATPQQVPSQQASPPLHQHRHEPQQQPTQLQASPAPLATAAPTTSTSTSTTTAPAATASATAAALSHKNSSNNNNSSSSGGSSNSNSKNSSSGASNPPPRPLPTPPIPPNHHSAPDNAAQDAKLFETLQAAIAASTAVAAAEGGAGVVGGGGGNSNTSALAAGAGGSSGTVGGAPASTAAPASVASAAAATPPLPAVSTVPTVSKGAGVGS